MAKRQSIKGLGREIYFKKTPGKGEVKQVNQFTDKQTKQQSPLERATFYIRLEQQEQLEKLKIKLRSKVGRQRKNRKRRVDKSELIRLAIELLNEQNDDLLIKRLTGKS
ncbi:MAG: hypothetical protein U9O41_04060 [Candidatus Aerophobetes bacterium]|nr:hypothetical protein [Candidatus Aerophobetes bacterium]